MLKRILGEAPFQVSLLQDIVVAPGKKTQAKPIFTNDSEYDLPLSCSLRMNCLVNADKSEFDITVPAQGKTQTELVFSLPEDSKIFGGVKVCTLEIFDRIFDSRTEYELYINCEMAYKCRETKEAVFEAKDEVLFTRNGVFFGNKGESVEIEIPTAEETEMEIRLLSGSIKQFDEKKYISLCKGLNRLQFEMQQDGSFEFINPSSGEKICLDTISPKYFI